MDVEEVRFFVARVGGRELKLVTVCLQCQYLRLRNGFPLLLNPSLLVYVKRNGTIEGTFGSS